MSAGYGLTPAFVFWSVCDDIEKTDKRIFLKAPRMVQGRDGQSGVPGLVRCLCNEETGSRLGLFVGPPQEAAVLETPAHIGLQAVARRLQRGRGLSKNEACPS